jgi:DNA polymerase delta subunit 1
MNDSSLSDGTPIYNIILTLNTCCSIPGALVCWFDTEKEMLLQWRQIVFLTDPDIITGYNCINFDLNYLLIRAMILKADMFPYLCKNIVHVY